MLIELGLGQIGKNAKKLSEAKAFEGRFRTEDSAIEVPAPQNVWHDTY